MLKIEGLTKTFGGVAALSDVSFSIREGSIHSVIGPNGAGKTTLFNIVTGIYPPSGGEIRLKGERIDGLAPEKLARKRVSRTFQNLKICHNMSACENVMLGAHLRLRQSILLAMLGTRSDMRRDRQCRDEAIALMEFASVARYADFPASQLPFGVLKRLEIARALAAKPRLLLLDEPAAGLNHTETHEVSLLIQKIAASGVTVVLVEHDMKMVMRISDHIVVLDYGKKLAEGTAEQVANNPDVIAAYLGAA